MYGLEIGLENARVQLGKGSTQRLHTWVPYTLVTRHRRLTSIPSTSEDPACKGFAEQTVDTWCARDVNELESSYAYVSAPPPRRKETVDRAGPHNKIPFSRGRE